MRTRTESDSQPSVPTLVQRVNALGGSCAQRGLVWGSTIYNEDVGSFIPYERTATMHDVVTPSWKTRQARGEIINNPYDRVEITTMREGITLDEVFADMTTITCSGASVQVYRNTGWKRVGLLNPSYLGTVFNSTPTTDLEALRAEATTGAYAKVGEGEAQGLVMLAEGQKTIKSFAQIFGRLIRIGRALKKWDVNYLRRQISAKELSDRWMEGRYAIRPVVYDMCDVVKALKKARTNKPHRQTARSGANFSGTNETSDVVVYTMANRWKLHATKTTKRDVQARSGVLSAVDAVSEATIWGLDQPVSALWELIPFSFVVDWFFNVGKTIAAWSPKYGIRTLASWVTVTDTVWQAIVQHHMEDILTSGYPIGQRYIISSGGYLSKITKTKARYANPSLSILPTYTVRLDAAKLIDLAIMAKRFF